MNLNIYKKNLLLLVSILCRLPSIIHSYCPYLLSKVPFCRDFSFSVNLGPNSFKFVLFPSLSKLYLNKNHNIKYKTTYFNVLINVVSKFNENLLVMPEKNKITLIMKRDASLSLKFRTVMKQSTQHSPNS